MSQNTFNPPFADLAGSIFLTLPSNLDLQELSNLIDYNKDILLKQLNKLKVIFDNYDLDSMQLLFVSYFEKAEITLYNSNFFKLTKSEIDKLILKSPQLDWDNYSSEFKIKPYSLDQKEILLNILINSFAVNFSRNIEGKSVITPNLNKQRYILDNFEKHCSNEDLQTFLVYAKSGEVVGTFGLNIIGGEVQLSAVAGRFVDFGNYIGYKGARKLPLISAAFVQIFKTHFTFIDCNKLTFSNSKPSVIEFYSNLGFENNLERKGFILSL